MPTLEIRTPEGITLRREVAGPGSRFAAILLDLIVIYLALLLVLLLTAVISGSDPSGMSQLAIGMMIGGIALAPAFYFWICGQLMDGQSPGKRALGLRAVSADGYPASSWQILLRSVLMIVDALPFVPVPGGLVVATVTERRQRIGDIVAGTIVVREPKAGHNPEPFEKLRYSELNNRAHEFASSVAGKLGRSDLDFLRSLLSRKGLDETVRRQLYLRAGKYYAKRLGLDGFEDARLLLRELYLFLREAREVRA